MAIDVLLGLQWGDEGKGKIVDVLTPHYQVIARFQGGPNAGHSLEFNGIKHVLHTIPSGIFHADCQNIVGNGVVIDPVIFQKETAALEAMQVNLTQSLLISRKAHLIYPHTDCSTKLRKRQKARLKLAPRLRALVQLIWIKPDVTGSAWAISNVPILWTNTVSW